MCEVLWGNRAVNRFKTLASKMYCTGSMTEEIIEQTDYLSSVQKYARFVFGLIHSAKFGLLINGALIQR